MIVTCDQCKTRFKIPDAKVTEKGVKVRCTKCQHTFRVTRPPEDTPAEVRPAPDFDPFSQFEDAEPTPPKPPAPAAVPTPPPEPPPAPPASPSTAGLESAELFGHEDSSLADSTSGPSFQADHGLFEMPAAPRPESPPPSALLSDVPDVEDAPAALEDAFPASRRPSTRPPPRTPARAGPRPLAAPGPVGGDYEADAQAPGAARQLSGIIVNLTLAGALLLVLTAAGNVYMNEGRLSWRALSPAGLAALFKPSSGLATRDVSNGIYETRTGRSVLFIRGLVENRLARTTEVAVHAEIWDGSQLLRAVDLRAGATPTPEDLFALNGAQDVDALNARLNEGRRSVSPGGILPFVVTFDANRTDLAGLQLKVQAFPVAPKQQ